MKIELYENPSDVRIEILPMIDVIFCILTFFILAAVGLTRQQAISLDLPTATSSAPVSRGRLYVSLDSAGQVYVDKSAIPPSLLPDVVRQYQQQVANGTIVLYAARGARYEDVVSVLDVLRSVGGDSVALATLPVDASLDPTQGRQTSAEDLLGQPGNLVPGTAPSQGGIPQGGIPQNSGGVTVTPLPSNPSGGALPPIGTPPVAPPPANPSTSPANP